MATLIIHNVDDDLLAELEAAARQEGCSLEAKVRTILESHRALRHRPTGAELLALADKIAAMTPKVPQTDSTEIVRQMRDER